MKPEKLLHKHDSIPCFTGEKDNGCVECIRNKAIEDYEKFLLTILKEVENKVLGDFARSYTNSQVIAFQMGVEKLAKTIKERIGG